jgi:hypothetical protein
MQDATQRTRSHGFPARSRRLATVRRTLVVAAIGLAAALALAVPLWLRDTAPGVEQTSYTELLSALEAGRVSEIVIHPGERIRGTWQATGSGAAGAADFEVVFPLERADALVELAVGEPEPATVVVHAGAEVLAREEPPAGPWLAETEGGQRLPSEAVRRLACDARIEWVLESDGRPLGLGRRGRTVSGPLLRVLRYRDGATCRFPGCERKRWLHAHHLVHWGDGGATNLDNLVLLCHAHHRLIHEGGWRTSGHPARDLRFHDPGGQPLRTMSDVIASRAPARLQS